MLPAVGIMALPGSPPAFVALLQALRPWCRPYAADHDDASPAAWLASSPACPGVTSTGRPYAVWIDDVEASEQAAALEPAPRVLVTSDPAVARPSVLFPRHGVDLRASLPFAPVIRQRWRSRLGLPATLIVNAGGGGPSRLPEDLLPTAIALASVVVATGPRLAEALAWAAPCVTDAPSAAALGANDDDVVIGRPGERETLAAALAGDDGRAAALSGAGRRLAERRLDHHRPARQVAHALGLVSHGGHVATRSTERVLDSLRTPSSSPPRLRVETLVAARP